jgi:hypothetical protein
MRLAMKLLPLAALAATLLAGPVMAQDTPTTRAFKANPDEAWSRVVRYLAVAGVTPSALDREGHTLMAEGTAEEGKWTDCPHARGVLRSLTYKVSVVVDKTPDGGSAVTVLMSGDGEAAKRRRFLVIPMGIRKTPLTCPSTGAFEKGLFTYLSGLE